MQTILLVHLYTVIRFVSITAKFDICTVVGLNGTLDIKRKYANGTLECAYFSFSNCPIQAPDASANAKFSTN